MAVGIDAGIAGRTANAPRRCVWRASIPQRVCSASIILENPRSSTQASGNIAEILGNRRVDQTKGQEGVMFSPFLDKRG